MPSIFRCNINQYIRHDPLTVNTNSNASNSYTCDDTDSTQTEWIQTYDVETHTNQLLIEQINDINTDHQKTSEVRSDSIDEPISILLQRDTVTNPTLVNTNTPDNEYDTAINATDEIDDCLYLNCLINVISPSFKATDSAYGVEEKSDSPIAETEDCATLVDIIQDECASDDSTQSIEKFNGTYDVTCRLCAKTFETDIGLIKIFSEDNERLMASINSIMPNTVSGYNVLMSSKLQVFMNFLLDIER